MTATQYKPPHGGYPGKVPSTIFPITRHKSEIDELVAEAMHEVDRFEEPLPGRKAKEIHCSYERYYWLLRLGQPWIDPTLINGELVYTFIGIPLKKDRTVLTGFRIV